MAAEAVRHADQEFADLLSSGLDSDEDPAKAIIACTRMLADYLRDSDWLDGCPLTATALETAGRVPEIEQAVADAFERWRAVVAEKLRRAGMADTLVDELAWTVINTLEGAELAAQGSKSESLC